MSEPTLYAIVTSQDGVTTRMGWISSATGITYCGICLGAAVEPRVGELCAGCGACVIGVFDEQADPETIRRAWSHARFASSEHALESIAS
jgi:hypothetical protein